MAMSRSECGKLGALKIRTHQAQMKQNRIIEYNKNPKKCLCCNKIIPYEKRHLKFCDHTCAATYNNIKRERHGKITTCINCGTNFNYRNGKYCSIKCQHEYEWKIVCENIETNQIASHAMIKKYLLRKKHKCSICGTSKWLGEPILLILDHVDGDSNNTRLSNCRLVCSNCDATLPTYKNKNKNGTRFTRRKRYADGKTY